MGVIGVQVHGDFHRKPVPSSSATIKSNVYLMHNHVISIETLFAVHYQSATWHNFQMAYLWHLVNSCIDNVH